MHADRTGSSAAQEPMDLDRALEEFDGDRDFLLGLLDGFVLTVSGQIEALRTAIGAGDAGKVRLLAHSIKGGAANLTADALSGAARDLELLAGTGTLHGVEEVLERLVQEFSRLDAWARSI